MKTTYLIYTGNYSESFIGWVCTEENKKEVIEHLLRGEYSIYIEHGELIDIEFNSRPSKGDIEVIIGYLDPYGDVQGTIWYLDPAKTLQSS